MGAAPVELVEQAPVTVNATRFGTFLVDFGRVAFGNIRLDPPDGAAGSVTIHFGESLVDGRVNRSPPGSVRYAHVDVDLPGARDLVVAPPPDTRNSTHPAAVHTPAEWGVVVPFRWVEIESWPGALEPSMIRRRAAFLSGWDDDATSFESSDPMLDRVWELCRYSIKATTFAGVYVDGDRERIAYEADAYLNQLGHYACDTDTTMARATFDRLLALPTWPTEWAFHIIFMAHADWMHTGDREWLSSRYESLKPKLLDERAREDGLLTSNDAQIEKGDLVDWPAGERDGFVMTPMNTVVNAFHLRALARMADLADAVGRTNDAIGYRERRSTATRAFVGKLFDADRGVFRDGEGTDHASLHANLFPLAFDLVPADRRASVASWVARRGMVCSVYAAQYLLEGLFESGLDREAVALMLAPGDRSWRHMVESGTTITWEAWDQRYKPNQDWNHAWGAAPANLLPRYVLGVRPLAPGWARVLIRPHVAGLAWAGGRVPTPRGPILVRWEVGEGFRLRLELPEVVTARVEVPGAESSTSVVIDGRPSVARRVGGYWVLDEDVVAKRDVEVR